MTTKIFFVLGAMIFVPGKFLEASFKESSVTPYYFVGLKLDNEEEEFCIIPREDWDESWDQLKKQYEIPIGDQYSFTVGNVPHTKFATRPSYLVSESLASKEDLKYFLRGIVIHETEISTSGETGLNQIRRVRNSQINYRGFTDIAYNYGIDDLGNIYALRGDEFVGLHAGETEECEEYRIEHIKEWAVGPCPISPARHAVVDSLYFNAMKMDPDYGYLGIVLCGNFNAGHSSPTEAQLRSLKWLLSRLKVKYDIPLCGIILHNQVVEEVVKPSGLTPKTKNGILVPKKCPGENFPERESIVEGLPPDSELASTKNILCLRIN